MRRTATALSLLCAVALAACGEGSTATHSSSRHAAAARRASTTTAAAAPAAPAQLSYRPLYALPAPLRDPAYASLGGDRFALLGGLDSADVSTGEIDVADPAHAGQAATMPEAQHDAQAATLGGQVYVFGGGSLSELDHIVAFDPATNAVHTVGTLPSASSDVAVAAVGDTAYVVGGYDGSSWLDTIIAWRSPGPARVVARLPVGLRYSAVAAVGGKLVIAGGSAPAGASRAIYAFDPASGQVSRFGTLPAPLTHAEAATLGSFVYLVGGRGDSLTSQTAAVLAIDPATGAVHPAGSLPTPLSDAAVISTGSALLVAGGLSPSATVATVGELAPR